MLHALPRRDTDRTSAHGACVARCLRVTGVMHVEPCRVCMKLLETFSLKYLLI